MNTKLSSAHGFTLLEMLLAIGSVALLMVMLSKVSTDFIQQRTAQAAGQQMFRMADIAEDALMRSSPVMLGPASAIVDSTHGAEMYQALLNNDFNVGPNSPFRIANSPVNVLYGINTSGAGPGAGILLFRTMIVLQKAYPITQAIKIARAIGTRGGVIRYDQPGKIISAFGNWSYPMSGVVLANMSSATTGSLQAGEAFVVSYRAIAPSEVTGPYLNVWGRNGGNVMYNDILMNGNSIVKAKDIDAGTVTATKAARFDQLAVNGSADFQGGVDAGDAVNITGNLAIADGDMSVTNGDLKVPGGNVSAKGLRADKLEADDLTTKDLSTKTLTVDGGDTLITSNLTVSGGASFDLTGALKASVVDAEDIKADTMKTKTMDVKGTTTLMGATTINNTANVDQLVLGGCMIMDGKTYGTCR